MSTLEIDYSINRIIYKDYISIDSSEGPQHNGLQNKLILILLIRTIEPNISKFVQFNDSIAYLCFKCKGCNVKHSGGNKM